MCEVRIIKCEVMEVMGEVNVVICEVRSNI